MTELLNFKCTRLCHDTIIRRFHLKSEARIRLEYLHLCDLSALVIASEDGDSILITHLKGDEKSHRLNTVVATINVVAHEEVVRVGWLTSDLEKLAQVVELTVDITADGDGSAHLLHVRLVNQDFFSLDDTSICWVNFDRLTLGLSFCLVCGKTGQMTVRG